MKNKVILCVWNYSRKDWIEPFELLKHEFEFVFISKMHKSLEDSDINFKIKYWMDFADVDTMIDEIMPAKVVFMSVHHLPDMILNFACLKRKIPTYILQHGMFYDLNTYQKRQNQIANIKTIHEKDSKLENVIGRRSKLFWQLRFGKKYWLSKFGISTIKYLLDKKRIGDIAAMENNKYAERHPYRILCYTVENAGVYHFRDGVALNKFIPIGNPTLDKFFSHKYNLSEAADYILLIDTPLYQVNSKSKGAGMLKETVMPFYKKANEVAKGINKKLFIKLHPFMYDAEDHIKDRNIVYIRHCDNLPKLLDEAYGCISFSSTLLLPSLCFKPTIIIDVTENSFINFVKKHNIAKVYDLLNFEHSNISFEVNKNAYNILKEEFLYKTDGKSTARLAQQLAENVE